MPVTHIIISGMTFQWPLNLNTWDWTPYLFSYVQHWPTYTCNYVSKSIIQQWLH